MPALHAPVAKRIHQPNCSGLFPAVPRLPQCVHRDASCGTPDPVASWALSLLPLDMGLATRVNPAFRRTSGELNAPRLPKIAISTYVCRAITKREEDSLAPETSFPGEIFQLAKTAFHRSFAVSASQLARAGIEAMTDCLCLYGAKPVSLEHLPCDAFNSGYRHAPQIHQGTDEMLCGWRQQIECPLHPSYGDLADIKRQINVTLATRRHIKAVIALG